MNRHPLVGWLLLAPSLLLLGGLVVFPILYNVWLSLHDKHAFMPVQAFVGLRHYRYFASDPEFWTSFYYGSVYAGVTMVLQLGVGVPAALLLNEAFRGRNLLRGVVLFPYMIPTIVAVILWKWLLNDSYGLVNHLLLSAGLVRGPVPWLGKDFIMWSLVLTSVWQFFPFVVVTFLARLQTIPPELYEAAKVDGATAWRRFLHVTLPQTLPGVVSAAALTFVPLVGMFFVPLLVGGPTSVMIAPLIANQMQAFQLGLGAALSFIVALIVMAALALPWRYLDLDRLER